MDVNELVRLVDVGRREKDEGRIRRLAVSEIIPKIDVTAADGKVVKGRLVAVIIGSQIGDEHQVGVAAVAAPKVPAGPVQAGVIDMIGVVVPVVVETEPMGGTGIHALGVDDASMDPGWAVDRPDLARSGESRSGRSSTSAATAASSNPHTLTLFNFLILPPKFSLNQQFGSSSGKRHSGTLLKVDTKYGEQNTHQSLEVPVTRLVIER